MDERRARRVSETVREELAEIIGFEMDDPRLLAVTVSNVHVSPDGRHATVLIAVTGGPDEQRQALAALDHASSFLRHELAIRLSLRRVPELHFESDRHPDSESRLDLLLKRARKARSRSQPDQST